MQSIIRPYQPSDLTHLMAAWEKANAMAHPFLGDEFVAQVRQDISVLYIPNAETWVAEVNAGVVGFIALLGNEIGALFLDPEFHGQSIGRALIDKARQLHGDLEVEVFKQNKIGRRFYATYGFELFEQQFHQPSGQEVLRLKFKSVS